MAKIEELKFDHKNFNKHTPEGMELIKKSLKQLGAGRSIVLDRNNNIIAGNGVVEAAGNIGMDEVQIVESDGTKIIAVKRTDIDIDSKQGRELALADNSTAAADLQWDFEAIADVEQEWGIDCDEWGVETPTQNKKAVEDDFDPDEDDIKIICKKGDIWQLGQHRLMCGDSSDENELSRLLNGVKIDLLITDPPYGVSIGDKNVALDAISGRKTNSIKRNILNDTLGEKELYDLLVKVFKNASAVLSDTNSIYVSSPQGGSLGLMMMMMMKDAGLEVRHILNWVKSSQTFSMRRLDYDYKHEPIFYTWKGKHKFYGKGQYKHTCWEFSKPQKCDLHPTMKPVALIEEMMLNSSKMGDNVLDLFGGSGTTLIACEQLSRKCYMMELDPRYCDIIIARWEKLTNQKAEKL